MKLSKDKMRIMELEQQMSKLLSRLNEVEQFDVSRQNQINDLKSRIGDLAHENSVIRQSESKARDEMRKQKEECDKILVMAFKKILNETN